MSTENTSPTYTRDVATGRLVCTAETPMPRGGIPQERWIHEDGAEVGEQESGWPGGDIIRVRCPHCGLEWKEELPQ